MTHTNDTLLTSKISAGGGAAVGDILLGWEPPVSLLCIRPYLRKLVITLYKKVVCVCVCVLSVCLDRLR